jgi:hypothetical protein
MSPRPSTLALACLLSLSAGAPTAQARPAGSAALRVGVRIIADCARAGASADPACRPAHQRSDGRAPVPAQVSALSPPAPPTKAGQAPRVTVTY